MKKKIKEQKKEQKSEQESSDVNEIPSLKSSSKSNPSINEEKKNTDEKINLHWGFFAAERTIREHGEQEIYTCASGVTPSGVIHIGNFREIITVDIVKRAFHLMGKKARHIHSWDNYDVFRKVPKNMPHPEILSQYLRMSIVDTPDTTGKYKNYAEMNLKAVEETLPLVGIYPEYKYQAEMYKSCKYANEIKKALEHKDEIIEILNQFKTEPVEKDWLPISIFCGNCKKDTINKIEWKGDFILYYECNNCGNKEEFDFRKKGIVKLPWRVDWPMRWYYEKVNFEPGGKDHSSEGGSYDTAKLIVKKIWNWNPPTYQMYDFINVKGSKGKMSSSSGEVVTLSDCLEIYQPEVLRYLFVGTRPNTEFLISFDTDVIKVYEDYDRCERIYYGIEQANEKEKEKNKWIYILSQVNENPDELPKNMPKQFPFRQLTQTLNICLMDEKKAFDFYLPELKTEYEKQKLKSRLKCAKNWLEKYADDNFKFKVNSEKRTDFFESLNEQEKKALSMLKETIIKTDDPEKLNELIFEIPQKLGMKMQDFFALCYQAIISKSQGPKLAKFILEIGKERVLKLL